MSENPSDIVKMSACNLQVDDLVWAKVFESPHWPAKISQPNEMNPNENIPHHFVYLFGIHKNIWVSDANIVLHSDEMLEIFHTSKKSSVFHDAFEEMKREIEERKHLNTLSRREKISLGKSSIIKLPNIPTVQVGEYSSAKSAIPAMPSVNKSLLTSTKQKAFPIKCKLNTMNYSKKLNKLVTKVPQKRKHSNSFTNSKLLPTTTKDCKILPSTSKDYQLPSTSTDYQPPSTSKDLSTSIDYQLPSTSKDYQLPSTSKDNQLPSTSKDNQLPSTSKDLINWKLDKLLNNEFPSSDVNEFALDSFISLEDSDNISSDDDQSIDNLVESLLSLQAEINTMSNVVRATDKEIGFLFLGEIGSMFARKLLDAGHFLTVYNCSNEKCDEFVKDGAEKAQFPADVIKKCDITFCCVSDEKALKDVVFGQKGVLEGFDEWNKKGYKAYVDMTPIDPKKSQEIGDKISSKCGKYLEAPFMVSRKLNKQEAVLIICAGNTVLYHDCITCFCSISSEAFYMGPNVGDASTMKVVLSMIMGAVHAALLETMSLSCESKLPLHTFIEFLCHGRLNCKSILIKAFDMLEDDITFTSGYESLQKDLYAASLLAESYSQPLPLAAAVNQYFMSAKHVDYKSLVAKYKEAMKEQDIFENM